MIGELKSAFESHDFELFEKLVMASNDDPYGFNYINNLVLSKMNESNDNTKEGQSSEAFHEACDQEDNASIIEQLDDSIIKMKIQAVLKNDIIIGRGSSPSLFILSFYTIYQHVCILERK